MAKSYPEPEMARIWGEPLPKFSKTTNNIEKYEEKRREEVIKHTLHLTTNMSAILKQIATQKNRYKPLPMKAPARHVMASS